MDGQIPKKPRSRLRLLAYGILSMTAFGAAGIAFLIWKFTPLMQVDEKNDRVSFLGGWIQIDGRQGSFKFGAQSLNANQNAEHLQGKKIFKKSNTPRGLVSTTHAQLRIRMGGGYLRLTTSVEPEMKWQCDLLKGADALDVSQVGEQTVIDLSKGRFSRCTFAVPAEVSVAVEGINGRVDFEKPAFDLFVSIENGKMGFVRDPALHYHFDTHLSQTRMLGLPKMPPNSATRTPDEVLIGITLTTGTLVFE